jgi:hypothetical protein
MRYQPRGAITGAIKLATTTLHHCAACGMWASKAILNFRQRKPVDFLHIGGEGV